VTMAIDESSGRQAPPAWRKVLTVPIIVALAAGLAITLLQFWLNVAGAAINPTPHEVPIAVVGSAPAVQQLAAQLQRGDRFTVKPASNDAAAIRLVNDRRADGIVNLNARVVQTAEAASVPAAGALEQLFSTNLGFRVFDIRPLQKHDPNGLGLLFLAIAFGLGGLPAGIIFAFLSARRRPMSIADAWRRALLVVVYGVVLSFAVAAVAVPLLGYGGSHFLTIWGWGALLTAAAMATGLALVALVGLAGVPVGLLVILLFGVPSSPVPVQPWNFAPAAYRVLGPYDPVGAAVDGTRNGLYFGGASLTRNLLVLLGWIVVPLLALLTLGWRSERSSLAPAEPAIATTPVGVARDS
jgi:hypothetical protein